MCEVLVATLRRVSAPRISDRVERNAMDMPGSNRPTLKYTYASCTIITIIRKRFSISKTQGGNILYNAIYNNILTHDEVSGVVEIYL